MMLVANCIYKLLLKQRLLGTGVLVKEVCLRQPAELLKDKF